MATMKWHEIREALCRRHDVPAAPPPAEFWSRFRTRIESEPRPRQEEVRAFQAPVIPWRFAWAAAAVAVLAFTLLLVAPHRRDSRASRVDEIEVYVSYSTMMIMQDAKTGGAVVWLTDLDMMDADSDEDVFDEEG